MRHKLFVICLLVISSMQARTIMWPGNAENYNCALIELTIYENMDDSIFNKFINMTYPENRQSMPAFSIRLSPYGIESIKILSLYGAWMPLSFYNNVCTALINQNQYPWIIGSSSGIKSYDELSNQKKVLNNDSLSLKSVFIKNLTFQMEKDTLNEFECYTLVLFYPRPDLGDMRCVYQHPPTREEILLNRRQFIEKWLRDKNTSININGIEDTEYSKVFVNEVLMKYKFNETNINLLLPK